MSTHVNKDGQPHMVDVGDKRISRRRAVAEAWVRFPEDLPEDLGNWQVPKGPVITTAIVAGIQGAKRCPDLIPLCHSLGLSHCDIKMDSIDGKLRIRCAVETSAQTGVEMEALTGASVAALTVYDMAKGIYKGIEIERIWLVQKSGGKSDFSLIDE